MRKIPGDGLEPAKAVEMIKEMVNKSTDSDNQWPRSGHWLRVMLVVCARRVTERAR